MEKSIDVDGEGDDGDESLSLSDALKLLAQSDLDEISSLKDGEYFEDEFFELFKTNPDLVDQSVANNNNNDDDVDVVWLRPFKIEPRCQFGLDAHLSPDEVVQGNLNDCAFCAATSSLAKYPDLLRRILPDERDTFLYGPKYKGYYRFRFWIYGEWIDVYIDDRLPTKNRRLLYCHCTTSHVFWAPLLEKAYAKLKGSYLNLVGINNVTVLTELTGGIFLTLNTQDFSSFPNRYRVENELIGQVNHGYFVACASIKKEFTANGSIGHAYSLLSINQLRIDGTDTRVYTLRNPHGKATEEDRYHPKFSFWNDVNEPTKRQMFYDKSRDVISWFSNTTFNYYFDELALLYSIPSGEQPSCFLFDFHDKWDREFARHETRYLVFNQHYLLEVKEKKSDILLNLIQEELSDHEKCSLSFYLFPVRRLPSNRQLADGLKRIGSVRYELENGKTYHLSRQISALFDLLPGFYVLLPVVREASMKTKTLSYLFRCASNNAIHVERLNLDADSFKLYTDDKFINLVTTKCNACNALIGSGVFKVYNEMSYHNECYDKLVDCLYDCCREPLKTFCLADVGLKYCKKCHDKHWNDEYLSV